MLNISYLVTIASTPADETIISAVTQAVQTHLDITPLPDDTTIVAADGTSIGISQIRDIQHSSTYPPRGETRLVIVWGAQQLTQQAQNAFLKILEEPPHHTCLVLVSTSNHQLLDTIISRCITLNLALATETDQQAEYEPTIAAIAEAITTKELTYSRAIELAGEVSDRAAAQQVIAGVIERLLPARAKSGTATHILHILNQTYERLQSNVNLKLTLEQSLFDVKNELEQ